MKQTKFLAIVLIAAGSLGFLYAGFADNEIIQTGKAAPEEMTVINAETAHVPETISPPSSRHPVTTRSSARHTTRSYRLPYRNWPEPLVNQRKHSRAFNFTLFVLFIRQTMTPALHQYAPS